MNYPENEYLDASNDAAHSRLIHQLIGKTDKHCFELKRKDEHGKTRKIKCYGSGGQGSRIRHAVDGYFFEHRVGTHQENNYFSVIIATGELNHNETNRDTRIVLYYNSPEEYERHLFETVSKATKDQWRSRQKAVFPLSPGS
jgi:hypothetical protein